MRPLGASDPHAAGRYRLLAELGRGGMGRVLLGAGPDGRLVAVKFVHAAFAGDQGFRGRFLREVEASRRVSGAYTAAVVDADPDADVPWLASVFVPATSLEDVLAETGPLPEQPVLRLAAGLATALSEVHRAELVHRDLKPSNVLLTDDGLRVIDFGIARAVDTESGGQVTRTGLLVGSPGFMSPEQAESRELTPASDVFCLGSVLVAACIGESPFTAPSTLRTLNNVVTTEPDLGPLPERIRRIVEPCLAKDPARRPAPAELLSLVPPVPPSARPWPDAVHESIGRVRASVAALLDTAAGEPAGPPKETPPRNPTRMQVAPPFELGDAPDPGPVEPPGRDSVLAIIGALAVAVVVAIALVWALLPGSRAIDGSAVAAPSPSPSAPPATSTSEAATTSDAPPGELVALRMYWHGDRADNATCSSIRCVDAQNRAGYTLVRREGSALVTEAPGTVPLRWYWNAERGDNILCGTTDCAAAQEAAQYELVGTEGWVYPTQKAGTVPLRLFWNAERGDNMLCVTDACIESAESSDYNFVRVEGWGYP